MVILEDHRMWAGCSASLHSLLANGITCTNFRPECITAHLDCLRARSLPSCDIATTGNEASTCVHGSSSVLSYTERLGVLL